MSAIASIYKESKNTFPWREYNSPCDILTLENVPRLDELINIGGIPYKVRNIVWHIDDRGGNCKAVSIFVYKL